MRLPYLALTLSAVTLAGATEVVAKPYKGAELYSRQAVLYGRMEMRMRMIRGSGLLSTFFTYKNGSEVAGAAWEEIDIEVLGKNDAKGLQSNIITGNPSMTSERVHAAASSLADGYHTYTLEWTPEYVSWSLDGVVVRRTEGGQVSSLISPQTLRFNAWSSETTSWVGAFDEAALPAYQFVNWIKYYRYENGQFVLDWTDEFDTLDASRWAVANWTFDTNRVDFVPANAVVQDGTLVLAITTEGATGFVGTVPVDDGGAGGAGGTGGAGQGGGDGGGSGCSLASSETAASLNELGAALLILGLAIVGRSRSRRPRECTGAS